MRPDVVSNLLSLPFFRDIDGCDFPEDLPLATILANDGRILRYERGDIVYRSGEFNSSIFIVLSGSVYSATSPRSEAAISLALTNKGSNGVPRSEDFIRRLGSLLSTPKSGSSNSKATGQRNTSRISDIEPLIAGDLADRIGPNDIFGECEALTSSARANTHLAGDDETLILELRWPGAREIRHWSDNFRQLVDTRYRQRSLWIALRSSALFEHLDDSALRSIANYCLFETYGALDWTHRYQRERTADHGGTHIAAQEDIIAEQNHYLDDIILIHSGFVRMSKTFERSEKTLGYGSPGDVIGLEELKDSAGSGVPLHLRHSVRATGYADIIRIPARIVEKYVLETASSAQAGKIIPAANSTSESWLNFTIDNRFINGTQAMMIDLNRCVNCDECIRACAATHDNIPRFVRQGPSHQNLMITHACMHCADPVCLTDCPTGAIHRDAKSGNVIINDATCIGCATCANACPYDNIRMEEVRNADGAFHIDSDGVHIARATKCDFCTGLRNGPACQQACPHNALIRVDMRDTRAITEWLDYTH